jgi:Fe(3+) dicitrate transport protein
LAGNIFLVNQVNEHRVSNRSFLIGGIGLSYKHSHGIQAYANISQNYRSINFNDMRVINPNLVVDPNLKDEKGYSADMGVRGAIGELLNYDVSLFMINYTNRIGTYVPLNTLYQVRTNISNSRNLGLETFAELDVWRLIQGDKAKMKLSVFSNFTLINAKYLGSKESAFRDKKVELVPSLLWKTGITLKKNRWSASYQFSYTSQQFTDATNATFTFNAVNGIIPSYSVMDFTVQYAFKKYFTLIGTVNNLADQRYFTRRADSYPGPGIIPSDARSYYLTLQVKL